MARSCAVCKSLNKKKIERELLGGTSMAELARKYKISTRAIGNHKKNHMTVDIAKSMMSRMKSLRVPPIDLKKELPQLSNLSDCVSYIHSETLDVYLDAKENGNSQVRLQALKLDMDCIGLAMKGKELMMSYQSQGSWEKILPKILKAVEDNPDAKIAISTALREAQVKTTAEEVLR